ncbi:16S rRNA (cytosine(1402)-N(4))-methyltransferase RsmH [Prevotella cerevisiae]|uniref:Ribosomal RNA small subunit methyltransferase H n=1 Tax=Segatella cerevisiae TaxID=2053716 RepID=A0ABT1BU48_9BACT|nr:16S rRNA (cytosine(1402)-N(4))-methyltransferase RsmH [Segatella cerevisiae]MCO6024499.1 16S rRNA (cytosine(1402)-N(4))-methyltransferase RsmH [Segatella cerevisiae]
MQESTPYHIPVLLEESVDGLNIHRDGIYVDATFGGGGHSRKILSKLEGKGHLYSFDQDEDAEANIHGDCTVDGDKETEHFTFIHSNFRYLKNWMRYYHVEAIDGLLADLGVSSHLFDDQSRGFSFRFNGPLDMRMNTKSETTAADIINNYDEERLSDVLYLYGELKNARRIASVLVKARAQKRIVTTQDLLDKVEPLFKKDREKKDMAKLFQALRIEVNHEMAALTELLLSAEKLLRPGGRLVVITYQSLEDRIVKDIMKSGNIKGKITSDFYGQINTPFKLINNKVITPDKEELERNPRSRSAKLRIAEKK